LAIPESIKQIVITSVDRYYASVGYESDEKLAGGMGAVGLDVGIKHFLTASGGIQIEPLNGFREQETKLKREQRRLSRKERGSENRKKQIVKLERLYQKMRDVRSDFNHKASSDSQALRYRCD